MSIAKAKVALGRSFRPGDVACLFKAVKGDGQVGINADSLRVFLEEMCQDYSERQIQYIFKMLDRERKGIIHQSEFERLLAPESIE